MATQRRLPTLNASDRNAALKVLRASPIVAEVQQTLDRRRGRKLSVSVEAALLALVLAAGKGAGHAARLHRCAAMLHHLHATGYRTGLPTDLLDELVRTRCPDRRRRLTRAVYRRLLNTLDAIATWGTATTDGLANIDRLSHTLLLASVPAAVRAYRSHAFDSAGVQASRRRPPYRGDKQDQPDVIDKDDKTGRKKRQDVDRTQATIRYRTYTTDDGERIEKELYGYGLHLDARIDPTGDDPTLWIGGLKLTPGHISEPVTAANQLNLDAQLREPLLDLVVGDRAYSQSTTLRTVIHQLHGDLVMDLNDYHEHAFRHPSGMWIFNGAAYDPATPPELFRQRRRKMHESINAWLADRDATLGEYRLKLHQQPDVYGVHRVVGNCVRKGVNCPLRPDLARPGAPLYPNPPITGPSHAICKGSTVQLDRDDYVIPRANRTAGIPTYQPLPYGSYEHAAVYQPWRSRTEGALGTLTGHHGLWGGHRGFLVANFHVIELLTLAAGIAYNLTRQGHFIPDHGTQDLRNDRVLDIPDTQVQSLRRLLTSRARHRDRFDPTTCREHHHPTPKPILIDSSSDPPA